ncbi:hypothetical protein ACWFMI_27125 [Nocardiopsis terrae]
MDAENQPLTVADLRALIDGLPDDTPVRFAPEDEDYADLHVLTHAAVDRLTIRWDRHGPEHEGRPYLLLDGRPEDIDEHGQLTAPATTEDV